MCLESLLGHVIQVHEDLVVARVEGKLVKELSNMHHIEEFVDQ